MKKLLIVILTLCLSVSAFAAEVTIEWDPNPPEEQVTGYVIAYSEGISRLDPTFPGYQVEVDVGNVTQHTITGLTFGRTQYFFAVLAYNGAGLRSDYSDEVNKDFTPDYNAENPPTIPAGVRVIAASW